jgi:transcriptional pleiotropic regulator of transition state genes
MSQVKHKVISKGGSLTIPASIRREYNSFLGGEAVNLVVQDGKLVIEPYTPKCLFCDSQEGVVKQKGRYVCKKCISEMAQEVG